MRRKAIGVPGLNTQADWAAGSDEKTDNGWDIYPQGFYEILKSISSHVGPLPIEITENGAAYNMMPDQHGHMHDKKRIVWLQKHLLELVARDPRRRAGARIPLLEPARQFRMGRRLYAALRPRLCRFQDRQQRTIKDSGAWYAKVIAANRVV